MEKKFIYEAPEMEQIVLMNESAMLAGSEKYGDNGEAGGPQSYNRYNDDF